MNSIKNLLALTLWVLPLGLQAADTAAPWHDLLGKASPAVQTEWGIKYAYGKGVRQDYSRAMDLYCVAARRGYAAAQYQLGWLYANGRGVARDDALAAAWFRLAAAQGHVQAGNMLAMLRGINQTPKPVCATARPERRQIEEWVYRFAPNYGLDPKLVLAVIEAESAFNPEARSPKDARGLMQLLPATADRFGVRDIMDPLQNLHGGMAYLRWLLAFFQGNVRLTLAAYNAGEGAVEKYRGIPPYPETQAYVAKITRVYNRLVHPAVIPVVKPSTLLIALEVQ